MMKNVKLNILHVKISKFNQCIVLVIRTDITRHLKVNKFTQ